MKVSFLAVFHVAVASVDHAADVSCTADEQSLLQGVTAVRKVSEHRSDNQRPGQAHYVGCFVDDPQRDLGQIVGGSNDAATNTFAGCRAACGDSQYMSLQYGGECFCADSYGNGPQYRQVSDSECNRNHEPCSSNSFNCGGSWRQAIYEINPGKDHYVGCFIDDAQRDLGQIVGGSNDAATNTFANCRAACGTSRYMSLQHGGECFCADSYGNGAQYRQVSDSECNRIHEPCSSNSFNCGGSWRQAIYEINAPTYFLAMPGAPQCVNGGETVGADECNAAVHHFAEAAGRTPGRQLQRGSGGKCRDGGWGQVPTGCSAQSGGDWAAHFKTGHTDNRPRCVHEAYQLVCTTEQPANYRYVRGGQDGSCPAGSTRVSIEECPTLSGTVLSDGSMGNGALSNRRHRVDCARHFVHGAGCFVNRHRDVYSTAHHCPEAAGKGHEMWAVCKTAR